MPCSSVVAASKPSSSRARVGSATQWRMSPARYWPLRIGSTSASKPAPSASRDLHDRARSPCAEIHRVARGRLGLQGQQDPAHDVAHMDEVARLFAVLEDHRRVPVEQARSEDRGHPGIRIGERLVGSVDVEEAQRHRGDAVGGARDKRQLLVVALGDRVDRSRDQGLALACAHRLQYRSAVRAVELPLTRQQLLLGARWRRGAPVLGALVFALAVNRHRGGHDQPGRQRSLGDEPLQEDRGLHRVALGVASDLVHRLTDADGRGQVHDAVDTAQRAVGAGDISDLADDQLDRVRQLGASRRREPAPPGSRARRPHRRGQQARGRGVHL